jgi:pyrroloquinoline quinone (PQQ) biosynthesis protein C
MNNSERLQQVTQPERERLQSVPVIQRALRGNVTRELYVAFLTQAYHHVRHTVPLMMAVGARLSTRHRWLQKELAHYIDEELGHEEWVLNDISAAGGNAAAVRDGAVAIETDAMVAYAYDTVMRRAPVGFFGMVHVLEGTSVALALAAATSIQRSLGLPDRAFSYLRSHGSLDQEHVGHLRSVLDRLDAEQDMPAVVTCARAMYWLYGNVFRSLERDAVIDSIPSARRSA